MPSKDKRKKKAWKVPDKYPAFCLLCLVMETDYITCHHLFQTDYKEEQNNRDLNMGGCSLSGDPRCNGGYFVY